VLAAANPGTEERMGVDLRKRSPPVSPHERIPALAEPGVLTHLPTDELTLRDLERDPLFVASVSADRDGFERGAMPELHKHSRAG